MGIPPFAGFWSKDEILLESLREGFFHEGEPLQLVQFVYICLAVAAFLTAVYTGRQLFLTFFGKPRDQHAYDHAHESPVSMWVPLAILAVFASVLGFWNTPFAPAFFHFVGEGGLVGLAQPFAEHEFDALALNSMWVSIGIALAGLFTAWVIYGFRPVAAGQPDPLARIPLIWNVLKNKYWLDEIYGYRIDLDGSTKAGLLIRFVGALSRLAFWIDRTVVDGLVNLAGWIGRLSARVWGWFDKNIIDGTVNATGSVTGEIAGWWRRMQTGNVQNYALLAAAGAMAFAILFLLRSFT
jgi:NADH-quinone oxidoreductase subunit L